MQDEVHQLLQIHAKLMQEFEEATDWLKNILGSIQDLLEQRRSLQGELPVQEPDQTVMTVQQCLRSHILQKLKGNVLVAYQLSKSHP